MNTQKTEAELKAILDSMRSKKQSTLPNTYTGKRGTQRNYW